MLGRWSAVATLLGSTCSWNYCPGSLILQLSAAPFALRNRAWTSWESTPEGFGEATQEWVLGSPKLRWFNLGPLQFSWELSPHLREGLAVRNPYCHWCSCQPFHMTLHSYFCINHQNLSLGLKCMFSCSRLSLIIITSTSTAGSNFINRENSSALWQRESTAH